MVVLFEGISSKIIAPRCIAIDIHVDIQASSPTCFIHTLYLIYYGLVCQVPAIYCNRHWFQRKTVFGERCADFVFSYAKILFSRCSQV